MLLNYGICGACRCTSCGILSLVCWWSWSWKFRSGIESLLFSPFLYFCTPFPKPFIHPSFDFSLKQATKPGKHQEATISHQRYCVLFNLWVTLPSIDISKPSSSQSKSIINTRYSSSSEFSNKRKNASKAQTQIEIISISTFLFLFSSTHRTVVVPGKIR